MPYTQALSDAGILASVESVGDAYANAMAESFVDSFKTELIVDRVWRTQQPARAGDRRMRRLVQQRSPARIPQRSVTGGVRGAIRTTGRDDSSPNRDNGFLGSHVIRSPQNSARLRAKPTQPRPTTIQDRNDAIRSESSPVAAESK